MYLGELIKSHREQEQLSQKIVADAIGVDVPMYSRMERGQRPIKKDQIKILSNLLKIKEEELYKYWVAEKVYNIVADEDNASEIFNIVSDKIIPYNKIK